MDGLPRCPDVPSRREVEAPNYLHRIRVAFPVSHLLFCTRVVDLVAREDVVDSLAHLQQLWLRDGARIAIEAGSESRARRRVQHLPLLGHRWRLIGLKRIVSFVRIDRC